MQNDSNDWDFNKELLHLGKRKTMNRKTLRICQLTLMIFLFLTSCQQKSESKKEAENTIQETEISL
jgi:hypothetical protein